MERAGGNADQLVGLLQQKNSYTRERAEQEFNRKFELVKEKIK